MDSFINPWDLLLWVFFVGASLIIGALVVVVLFLIVKTAMKEFFPDRGDREEDRHRAMNASFFVDTPTKDGGIDYESRMIFDTEKGIYRRKFKDGEKT